MTGVAYELPASSPVTVEFGVGWYGVGGGLNFYPGPGKQGLMYSARIGLWSESIAANVGVNYISRITDTIDWRAGVGVEYFQSGAWFAPTGTFPIVELDLGFHL